MFNRGILREMLRGVVARLHARGTSMGACDGLLDAVLQRGNRSANRYFASTLSEYTIYATYMMRHYPEMVKYSHATVYRHARNPPVHVWQHEEAHAKESNSTASFSCFITDAKLQMMKARMPNVSYVTWEDEKWRGRNRGTCPDDSTTLPQFPGLKEQVADEHAILFPTPPPAPPAPRAGPAARAPSELKVVPSCSARKLTVSLWHTFHPPPWGGGNQFLLALTHALRCKGVRVEHNSFEGIEQDVNAVLINAHTFSAGGFHSAWRKLLPPKRKQIVVVHRIDGPHSVNRACAPANAHPSPHTTGWS